MTVRTIKRTVTFMRPFTLDCFDRELPAGPYIVETDEELLEGISFPVYRRIATLIHLHSHAGLTQTLTIDPNELDAALERDRARTATFAETEADQRTLCREKESCLNEVDRRAIERAENEGMVLPLK